MAMKKIFSDYRVPHPTHRTFLLTDITDDVVTLSVGVDGKVVHRKLYTDREGDGYFTLNRMRYYLKFLHEI